MIPKYMVEIQLVEWQTGEVHPIETMFDFVRSHDAVIAAARTVRKIVLEDPDVHRADIVIDVSRNKPETGADGEYEYEVIRQLHFFEAMRELRNFEYNEDSKRERLIETITCPVDNCDGFDVIDADGEHGVVLHILGEGDMYLKHLRITSSTLQGFEEFASSIWQAVEWSGRLEQYYERLQKRFENGEDLF